LLSKASNSAFIAVCQFGSNRACLTVLGSVWDKRIRGCRKPLFARVFILCALIGTCATGIALGGMGGVCETVGDIDDFEVGIEQGDGWSDSQGIGLSLPELEETVGDKLLGEAGVGEEGQGTEEGIEINNTRFQ
jgi:hypothetical protein